MSDKIIQTYVFTNGKRYFISTHNHQIRDSRGRERRCRHSRRGVYGQWIK